MTFVIPITRSSVRFLSLACPRLTVLIFILAIKPHTLAARVLERKRAACVPKHSLGNAPFRLFRAKCPIDTSIDIFGIAFLAFSQVKHAYVLLSFRCCTPQTIFAVTGVGTPRIVVILAPFVFSNKWFTLPKLVRVFIKLTVLRRGAFIVRKTLKWLTPATGNRKLIAVIKDCTPKLCFARDNTKNQRSARNRKQSKIAQTETRPLSLHFRLGIFSVLIQTS